MKTLNNIWLHFHFARGTHAMVKQPATSIPHDLRTEFVQGDTMDETLMLAEGQHKDWASCQPLTSFTGEHEWFLHDSVVVVALRRGVFPPSYFYSQILQALRYNSSYSWFSCQNATQTVNEKMLGFFTLAKQRWRTCSLLRVTQIFQSLLASYILTHSKTYITLGKTNKNNVKATASHLPQRKAVTVNCRIKKVSEVKHYTRIHWSLVQTRKLKKGIFNDNKVGEKECVKEQLNKGIKRDTNTSRQNRNNKCARQSIEPADNQEIQKKIKPVH